MKNKVTLEKASVEILGALQKICEETYSIYFGSHWNGNGLALYLEEQFGTEQLQSDLQNEGVNYFIIRYENDAVGFIKLNYNVEVPGFDEKKVCELEKMYIYPTNKGKGIGKKALRLCFERAIKKESSVMILCVLDTNHTAISFYENLGFRFDRKIRLKYSKFKNELKGLNQMSIKLI